MSFSSYLYSRPAICSGTPQSLWDSREWTDYVRKTVRGYRYTSRAQLNDHDWDDIAQIATIHAWKKRALYDESKPFKPWLKVVTLSQIRNEIRNRCTYGFVNQASGFKYHLRNPQPLVTRNVNVARGVEEVVYEPDAIDPRTIRPEITLEDLPKLSKDEKAMLAALTDCPSPTKMLKRETKKGKIRPGNRRLLKLYKRRNRLRTIYRSVLNEK